VSARILRWEVPVDDRPHIHQFAGPIVHVGCRNRALVEFWSQEPDGGQRQARVFQVFGTGHNLPADASHIGSVITAGGQLVWHLMELGGDRSGNGSALER
jgi:hypothetical protein